MRRSKAGSDSTQCDVKDCELDSKRSVSIKKVKKALPSLKFETAGKKIHLCKEHYKQFKKATKTDRTLEKLTWE